MARRKFFECQYYGQSSGRCLHPRVNRGVAGGTAAGKPMAPPCPVEHGRGDDCPADDDKADRRSEVAKAAEEDAGER